MIRRPEKSKLIFISFILFMAIMVLIILWAILNRPERTISGEYMNNIPVYRLSASTLFDTNNLNKLVGDADHVFVAKVVSEDGNEYKFPVEVETADGGSAVATVPYTNYSIEVIENIKGELITNKVIPIQKEGGRYEDGSGYEIYQEDELPVVGGTYIFYSYVRDDGTLFVGGPNSNERIDIPRNTRASNIKKDVIESTEFKLVKDALNNQVKVRERVPNRSIYEVD
jgi:hypothetical protein